MEFSQDPLHILRYTNDPVLINSCIKELRAAGFRDPEGIARDLRSSL